MFTGLVEEKGTVTALEQLGDSVRLTIRGPVVTSDAAHGDSISVNGCCLTVAGAGRRRVRGRRHGRVARTHVPGRPRRGAEVNLERAMAAGARLGGHIVQGHVDGTARLIDRTPSEHWDVVRFACPADWPATWSRRARSPSTACR